MWPWMRRAFGYRLGAERVTVVYRRRIADMTALPAAITGAIADNCEFAELMAPDYVGAGCRRRGGGPVGSAAGDGPVSGAARRRCAPSANRPVSSARW